MRQPGEFAGTLSALPPTVRTLVRPRARPVSGLAGLGCLCLLLAACGGSSGGGAPSNRAPTVNAGADRTVFEGTEVDLSGTGSDPDGDALTFAWTQTDGPAVTLDNTNAAASGFVAPDVGAGAPETLTFRLDASDGTVTQSDSVNITVEENVAPVANAGPDQNVVQNTEVTLDGGASADPNSIDTLSFAWTQVAGPAVGLTGGDSAQPTFTAPAVGPGAVLELEFQLLVSDGVNDATDVVVVNVTETPPVVSVTGRVFYEFVPPASGCSGLDFNDTIVRPIRAATVQLLDANNSSVLGTTIADDAGNYSFAGIDGLRDVRLRVRAELKRSGQPAWDVEVRDNTSNTGQPLPARALYVMDSAEFSTGTADVHRDLTATTGWGGASYTDDRAAAPFAILDAIYSGMRRVLEAEPDVEFEALDAFWSVNNTTGNGDDADSGDIGTSFYTSNPDGGARNPSLFLLGDAEDDTEEFDDHVVVHEWGHYFEDTLSRSDSIGGAHSLGESLDARVAFGEGFATALAAIALDNPLYCDTGIPGTGAGFSINAESSGFGEQGWFNEISVVTILYDLWDATMDGTDTGSIGFVPIYETMRGPQATTEALTSIFSFAASLRPMLDTAGQSLLDSQLSRESIEPVVIDIWGDTEMNDAGGQDVLPLYTDMSADGSVLNICTNSDFDAGRTGNKLAEHRYIRLAVPVTDTYNVLVETTTNTPPTADPNDRDQSDPDVNVYADGLIVAQGISAVENVESFVTQATLQAGTTYVVEVEEWRFADAEAAPPNYPDRVCFDVSFTATP